MPAAMSLSGRPEYPESLSFLTPTQGIVVGPRSDSICGVPERFRTGGAHVFHSGHRLVVQLQRDHEHCPVPGRDVT